MEADMLNQLAEQAELKIPIHTHWWISTVDAQKNPLSEAPGFQEPSKSLWYPQSS